MRNRQMKKVMSVLLACMLLGSGAVYAQETESEQGMVSDLSS